MQPEFGIIGRTWWSTLLVIAITSTLLYFGKLSEDTWSMVTLGSLGLGVAKSATQAVATAKFGQTKPPPVEP